MHGTGKDPLLNQTIEGYKFVRLLGKGSLGAVYLAVNTHLKDKVAIRQINTRSTGAGTDIQCEIVTLVKLSHPNIVSIRAAHHFTDYCLMVMDLIRGSSLSSILEQIRGNIRLDLQTVVNGMQQVAEALDYIHQQDVLHLDLKPTNILLNPVPNRPVPLFMLGDFGISCFVKPDGLGVPMHEGTPPYMSPEHFGIDGRVPDKRADIYSLGVTLYELVVGERPFTAETYADLIRLHAYQPPRRPSASVPDIPPVLDEIILRALAKDPNARYQTAGEMAAHLAQAAALLPREETGGYILAKMAEEHAAELDKIRTTLEAGFDVVVYYPDGQSVEHHFDKNQIIVGRDPAVDLPLQEKLISKRHMQILKQEGQLYVEDLQSTNGTYLNAERLVPHQPTHWPPNVYLTIQNYTLLPGAADLIENPAPLVQPAQVAQVLAAAEEQNQPPRLLLNVSPEVVHARLNEPQSLRVMVKPEHAPLAHYQLRVVPGADIDERWYVLPSGQSIPAGETQFFDMTITAPQGVSSDVERQLILEVYADHPAIPPAVFVLVIQVMREMNFAVTVQPLEVTHRRGRKTTVIIHNHGNYTETFGVRVSAPSAPDALRIVPEHDQVTVGIAPKNEARVMLRFYPRRSAQKERRIGYQVHVNDSAGTVRSADGDYVFRGSGSRSLRRSVNLLITLLLVSVVVAVIGWVLLGEFDPATRDTFVNSLQNWIESLGEGQP
ncbi:MAG: hypothetical protein OHK0046_27760 [Anaerolineae bacterium]